MLPKETCELGYWQISELTQNRQQDSAEKKQRGWGETLLAVAKSCSDRCD